MDGRIGGRRGGWENGFEKVWVSEMMVGRGMDETMVGERLGEKMDGI